MQTRFFALLQKIKPSVIVWHQRTSWVLDHVAEAESHCQKANQDGPGSVGVQRRWSRIGSSEEVQYISHIFHIYDTCVYLHVYINILI
jgi:hypothetical protein